ncbi:MAG: cation diffusion facilitator family transporter [Candidatus Micrarchaeia archaeon]|jgi:cobalt-zinc-cadmium efflux system protein
MAETPQEHDLKMLLLALALTFLVFFAEAIGGAWSNSLALLGDAGHVLSDCLSLGVAALALWLSTRPAPSRRTFGYHRAEVFAAFFNGVLLLAISMFLVASAFQRLQNPPTVEAGGVLAISLIGLGANVWVAYKLHGHRNVNVQAAFWHAASDALSSVGVVVSSALILATGQHWIDAAVSIMIATAIFASAVLVLRSAVSILFETVPWGMKTEDVEKAMLSVKGVRGLHDLHVWSVCSELIFVAAHVNVADSKVSQTAGILEDITCRLREKFGISHVTLQFETPGYKCGKAIVCKMRH